MLILVSWMLTPTKASISVFCTELRFSSPPRSEAMLLDKLSQRRAAVVRSSKSARVMGVGLIGPCGRPRFLGGEPLGSGVGAKSVDSITQQVGSRSLSSTPIPGNCSKGYKLAYKSLKTHVFSE